MRVTVTALAERDDHLLLVQLARGRFSGFWLLPSASADEGAIATSIMPMMLERTGYAVSAAHLSGVMEETKNDLLALRFVFSVQVGDHPVGATDPEIAQARWFSRDAVREVLSERDMVPNLGVMSLVRNWVERKALSPLETLSEDVPCPCGSGFRYPGCCGWDAR